jgi:hypothetical protein
MIQRRDIVLLVATLLLGPPMAAILYLVLISMQLGQALLALAGALASLICVALVDASSRPASERA